MYCTVTPGLSDTSLSENLIYLTLCCESPPPLCVLFTLIYPTPGLSDTFYEEQTWSDKQGPIVHMYTCDAIYAYVSWVPVIFKSHPDSRRCCVYAYSVPVRVCMCVYMSECVCFVLYICGLVCMCASWHKGAVNAVLLCVWHSSKCHPSAHTHICILYSDSNPV